MKSPSILRSSLAIAAVKVFSSVSALGLTWLVARRSVADLGVFRTLFVFFLICEFFPLLGMQSYLFREVSRNPTLIKKYLLHSLVLALVVSVFAMGGLALLAHFGRYSPEIAQGIFIISAGLPATAASICGISILVGLSRGAVFGRIQAIETLARTGLGVLFIVLGWNILAVMAGFVACRWFILIAYWRAIAPFANAGTWTFDRPFFREFVAHIPTFAGITLLALVVRYAAQLMLPWMLDDKAAGQFGAAFIFIDIVLLVPTSFITNLVPRLSVHAQQSSAELAHACQQGVKIMALGVIPVAAMITVVAGPLIALLFRSNPAYLASVLALQIMIWICVFTSLDQVLSSSMLASGRQITDLQTLGVGATATLVALAALIPAHGVTGAALGVLIGSAVMVIFRIIFVARHLVGANPLALLWRPAVASASAAFVITLIPEHYWIAGVALGNVCYLVVLMALGTFTKAERLNLLSLLGSGETATSPSL